MSPALLLLSLALDVPPLSGRVVDVPKLLPDVVVKQVSADLDLYGAKTRDRVAVLIVPSLEGEPVEAFSRRVATTWKLAQKDLSDTGVLVLLSRDERKVRIEVGGAWGGVLTEAKASWIVERTMQPRLDAGDFGGAVSEGVEAILATLTSTEGRTKGSWRNTTVSTFTATPMSDGQATLWIVGHIFKEPGVIVSVTFGIVVGALVCLWSRWIGAVVAALIASVGPLSVMQAQRRAFSDLAWWAVPAAALEAAIAALIFGLVARALLKRLGLLPARRG